VNDVSTLIEATGPLLVLLPLFTSQRSDRVRKLGDELTKRREGIEEAALNAALAVVTAATLVVGGPTVVHTSRDAGVSRTAAAPTMLLIAWVLLLALFAWQVWLAVVAIRSIADLD
jgi:cation transporter-like permease